MILAPNAANFAIYGYLVLLPVITSATTTATSGIVLKFGEKEGKDINFAVLSTTTITTIDNGYLGG